MVIAMCRSCRRRTWERWSAIYKLAPFTPNQDTMMVENGIELLPIMFDNLLLTQVSSQINYATLVIEKFTYSCIKLSVLFFYRRIFAQRKSFRIANNVLIVLITLWGLVFMAMDAAACNPNAYEGRSGQTLQWLLLWFGITDVLGDIAVLALPYPCIRKLQMSTRDKVGLTAIFLLGTL